MYRGAFVLSCRFFVLWKPSARHQRPIVQLSIKQASMSSIHYKFKSSVEYDTLTFDGLHISLADLKKAILVQKKIGKSAEFDLQITNAQTGEEYKDESHLIPKNASVIVRRIPVGGVRANIKAEPVDLNGSPYLKSVCSSTIFDHNNMWSCVSLYNY